MTFTDALAAALPDVAIVLIVASCVFQLGMMVGGYRERRWQIEKERMAAKLAFYQSEVNKLCAEVESQYLTVDEVREMMNDCH